jgi:hypothetical protein
MVRGLMRGASYSRRFGDVQMTFRRCGQSVQDGPIKGLEFFAGGPIARRGGKRYFPAPIGVWGFAHEMLEASKIALLGRRQVVRHRFLVSTSQVRILAPQPIHPAFRQLTTLVLTNHAVQTLRQGL